MMQDELDYYDDPEDMPDEAYSDEYVNAPMRPGPTKARAAALDNSAFTSYGQRQLAALQALKDARQRAIQTLRPVDDKSRYLALAAGFFSPTRTGAFGESVGNALNNYLPYKQQQTQDEMKYQSALAGYDMDLAQAEYEQANKPPQIINTYTDDGGQQKAIIGPDGMPQPFGGVKMPRTGTDPMAKIRAYADAMNDPSLRPIVEQMLKKPGTSVEVKVDAKGAEKVNEAGISRANDKLTAIEKTLEIADQIPVMTELFNNSPDAAFGPQGEFFQDFVNFGKGVGLEFDDKWDNAQVARQIADRLTPMQKVAGSGSSSDRDMILFRSAIPNLYGSKNGALRSAFYWQRIGEYGQKVKELMEDYMDKGDYTLTSPEYRAAKKELDAKGIFSPEDRKILTDKKLIQSWANQVSGGGDTDANTILEQSGYEVRNGKIVKKSE